eukprot:scaffold111100_cov37-Prasinocladus_malaysianus.AAC.2
MMALPDRNAGLREISADVLNNLTSLKMLDISYNQFSSLDSLQQTKNLRIVDASHNMLAVPVDQLMASLPPGLEIFLAADNGLFGTLPASEEAWKVFENVTYLDFGYNSISGALPKELFLTMPKLEGVEMKNNSISGTLPSGISESLSWIGISGNNLSGSIPAAWWKTTQCVEAYGNPGLCGEFEHGQLMGGYDVLRCWPSPEAVAGTALGEPCPGELDGHTGASTLNVSQDILNPSLLPGQSLDRSRDNITLNTQADGNAAVANTLPEMATNEVGD